MSKTKEVEEIIKVVHNPEHNKPWEVKFDDLSGFKKIRAILNYPSHSFETEDKAIEVAEMLRDIVKADAVQVEGEPFLRDDVEPAEFFQPIQAEDENENPDSRWESEGGTTDDLMSSDVKDPFEIGEPEDQTVRSHTTVISETVEPVPRPDGARLVGNKPDRLG